VPRQGHETKVAEKRLARCAVLLTIVSAWCCVLTTACNGFNEDADQSRASGSKASVTGGGVAAGQPEQTLPAPRSSKGSETVGSGVTQEKRTNLEGRWKLISFTSGGITIGATKAPATSTLVFKDGMMRYGKIPDEGDSTRWPDYRFTIDPAQTPHLMDIALDGPSAPPRPCIYAIEGDELRICIPSGTKRPSVVKGTFENNLYIYRRLEP
jgi:uncharacterized protein (TIGR03067 family)